jgi:hypothetical protein
MKRIRSTSSSQIADKSSILDFFLFISFPLTCAPLRTKESNERKVGDDYDYDGVHRLSTSLLLKKVELASSTASLTYSS